MKLIIDIDEETKKNVGFYGLSLNPRDKENLVNSIKNGTPIEDKPQEVDESYLYDWYISSVSEDDSPVWTEEHIEELIHDFHLIPRKEQE